MPYLNWRETPVSSEVIPGGSGRPGGNDGEPCIRWELGVPESAYAALLSALEGALQARTELRLDLPRGWACFFKTRPSSSRLLIAHPSESEWVATIAVHEARVTALLEALRALPRQGKLSLADALEIVDSVSNLELWIARDVAHPGS